MQRCLAFVIDGVDLSIALDQNFSDVNVTGEYSAVEGSLSAIIFRIDVS